VVATTTIKYTLTGAVFTNGETLSGSWEAQYDANGNLLGIVSDTLVLANAPTSYAGLDGTAGTPTGVDHQIVLESGAGAVFLDWVGETPTALTTAQNDPYSQYTTSLNGGQAVLVNAGTITSQVMCFLAGTAIATPAGGRAIETLAMGDEVVLSDGRTAPIRWIGRKTIATRFADKLSAMPIRVRAGALGDHLPLRDLLVSPCHALLVEGMLVQAGALVNGTSIMRETVGPELITYYHIELADHALILAEGVAAETFVDNADRMGFDNWAEHEALFDAGTDVPEMELPRAKSARQMPGAIRMALAARAESLYGSTLAA